MFAVVFGLADFSTVPPTTALARKAFPDGGWALVLGLIGFAHQVGSALGGAIGGVVYDATGGYGAFFVGAAATCVAAAFLSMQIGRTPTSRVGGAWRRTAPAAASGLGRHGPAGPLEPLGSCQLVPVEPVHAVEMHDGRRDLSVARRS